MGKRSRKRSGEPAAKARPPRPAEPAAKARPPRPAEPDAKGREAEPRGRPDGDATNGAPRAPVKKPSRSEAKNAAAREALLPLAEGERPRAVTIAAVVAALFALGNLVAFLAGLEINGDKPQASGVISYSVLMGIAAWGMWRSKYWAVLGMQAILGILIVLFSVFLFEASNVQSALICVGVIVPAGLLFFHLVKAMARIQMPERRPS